MSNANLIFWVMRQSAETLANKIEQQQAQIDSLMLEYCPDEMTKEQMDNWAKYQKPYEEDV